MYFSRLAIGGRVCELARANARKSGGRRRTGLTGRCCLSRTMEKKRCESYDRIFPHVLVSAQEQGTQWAQLLDYCSFSQLCCQPCPYHCARSARGCAPPKAGSAVEVGYSRHHVFLTLGDWWKGVRACEGKRTQEWRTSSYRADGSLLFVENDGKEAL